MSSGGSSATGGKANVAPTTPIPFHISPASTAGLVKTIFSIFFSFNNLAAQTVAKNVLPVPAGPIAKVKSKFSIDSTYSLPASLMIIVCLVYFVLNEAL